MSTRELICDLASPITVGATLRCELLQVAPELWAYPTRHTFRWFVSRRSGAQVTSEQTITDTNELRIGTSTTGNLTVAVRVLANGSPTQMRFSLDRRVIDEDPHFAHLLGTSRLDETTARELIFDFGPYIIQSSAATGGHGVPSRLAAAVLYIEMFNRPKADRENELREVRELLLAFDKGDWIVPWQRINRSLGVGQIRLSTAAMLLDYTPWIEQDRSNREEARSQINTNFESLSIGLKFDLFGLLRWPASNIRTACQLLARLKNRSHRFPDLTQAEFMRNDDAVGIVATEYNQGGTSTPAAQAGASDYGVWARDFASDPLIHYFPAA
jgi:hypothetical protein